MLHDAVVVPVVVALGWLASRWLPPAARGPVRGALALSAILVVFAYPLVRRLGARPTNSSALPLHYGPNLALVLGVVWIVTVVLVVAAPASAPATVNVGRSERVIRATSAANRVPGARAATSRATEKVSTSASIGRGATEQPCSPQAGQLSETGPVGAHRDADEDAGIGRRSPIAQYPPSSAGPSTASTPGPHKVDVRPRAASA